MTDMTALTWPVHDEPGCVFCHGPAHTPVGSLAGIPIIACSAIEADRVRFVG